MSPMSPMAESITPIQDLAILSFSYGSSFSEVPMFRDPEPRASYSHTPALILSMLKQACVFATHCCFQSFPCSSPVLRQLTPWYSCLT